MADMPGPDRDDEREPSPLDDLLRQFGIDPASLPPGMLNGDLRDLGPLLSQLHIQFDVVASQLGTMFAMPKNGQTVNWEVTTSHARKVVAAAGADPTPSETQRRDAREAVDLAEQWLSQATTFEPLAVTGTAWSRAEWVEATMPTWSRLMDPIVAHLASALEQLAADQVGEEQRAEVRRHMQPMIRQAAAGMFAGQIGQAIGELGTSVLTGTEVVLPVLDKPTVALLPVTVEAYAAELEQPVREVRIYLALREAARQRLFVAVPWVSLQLLAQVEHFAREIRIDSRQLEETVSQATDIGAAELSELSAALFTPAETSEQKEILGRIQTLLALIEGWVDHVTIQAAGPWLANLSVMEETTRRRRAVRAPSSEALSTILGVQLEPQRIRAAANLWGALLAQRGTEGRDDVWRHPDLIPTAADLDDPLGYAAGESTPTDDLDRELDELLRSEGHSDEANED